MYRVGAECESFVFISRLPFLSDKVVSGGYSELGLSINVCKFTEWKAALISIRVWCWSHLDQIRRWVLKSWGNFSCKSYSRDLMDTPYTLWKAKVSLSMDYCSW